MSESADYDPGYWSGKSFTNARKDYDRVVTDRGYDDAKVSKKSSTDLLPKELKTDSPAPLVIVCDVTGSMGDWPGIIFSKLPYLANEVRNEYLGKKAEICFAAVGDAYSDQYPLQARPFVEVPDLKDKTKAPEFEKRLKELVIEKGGGGSSQESYDLAALYFARRVKMPKAVRPILIFIGDEGLYSTVDKDQAESIAYTKLEKSLTTKKVFEELKEKYEVFLIHKVYGSGSGDENASDKSVRAQWAELIGANRIAALPEAGRVVDVIFGILGNVTDREEYFESELKDRQTKVQVDTVMKSLADIRVDKKGAGASKGASVMPGSKKSGGKTKSLL